MTDKELQFNRTIGYVSLAGFIILIILTVLNPVIFTASGSENDILYQFIMNSLSVLSGVFGIVAFVGLCIGIPAIFNSRSKKISAALLLTVGIVMLILSYTIPREAETIMVIQYAPVALLYIVVGIVLLTRARIKNQR